MDSGGQLFMTTGGTVNARTITLVGTGNNETRGAIRLTSGTINSPLSLLGSATIGSEGGSLAGATITSGVAGTNTLTIGTGNSHSNLTISSNISDGLGVTALTATNGGGGH